MPKAIYLPTSAQRRKTAFRAQQQNSGKIKNSVWHLQPTHRTDDRQIKQNNFSWKGHDLRRSNSALNKKNRRYTIPSAKQIVASWKFLVLRKVIFKTTKFVYFCFKLICFMLLTSRMTVNFPLSLWIMWSAVSEESPGL